MKGKIFSLQNIIIILILFDIMSFSFSQISSVLPVYKILIADDLDNFRSKINYNIYFNIKGVGIVFNNNSDVSLIPMHIFNITIRYYQLTFYSIIDKIEKLPKGYSQYLLIESIIPYETIHFILEDMGITFPIKELFYSKKEDEDLVYYFRFLSREDQENIVIGRDLIELMNITFLDNNKFIINNKDYISKVEDKDS